jgi:hypothetical protein
MQLRDFVTKELPTSIADLSFSLSPTKLCAFLREAEKMRDMDKAETPGKNVKRLWKTKRKRSSSPVEELQEHHEKKFRAAENDALERGSQNDPYF